MKQVYKKWWFWLILIIVFFILGGNMDKSNTQKYEATNYIENYEWNLKDIKKSEIKFDNEETEEFKYVVLGVENRENDLKSGEYIIRTNDNRKASFVIYVTNEYFENVSELPEPYYGMVQGFDKSELNIKLEKGQYLYLLQNYNGQGKVIVEMNK